MQKIGIVTSARELNYGALLQAYALQEVVGRMGYDTSLLWWANQKESRRDIRLIKLLAIMLKFICHPSIIKKSVGAYGHTFSKEFSEISKKQFQDYEDECLKIGYLNYRQMKKYAYDVNCKAVIAGSDQIWNSYALYVDPFYYLRFAPQKKRIAYAPSLGKNSIPYYNKKTMRKYIIGFNHLSVREKSGGALLKELIGIDVPTVLDPSFLLNKDQWKIIERSVSVPTKYILFYFLDEPNEVCITMLKAIVKEIGLPVIAIPYKFERFSTFENLQYIDAGPKEFLYLIDNASIVLTDSFHGTAFSINYNKDFIVFDRQYGKNQTQVSRLLDLLKTFGVSERFVKSEYDINSIEKTINYEEINKTLDGLRISSIKYLTSSLDSI